MFDAAFVPKIFSVTRRFSACRISTRKFSAATWWIRTTTIPGADFYFCKETETWIKIRVSRFLYENIPAKQSRDPVNKYGNPNIFFTLAGIRDTTYVLNRLLCYPEIPSRSSNEPRYKRLMSCLTSNLQSWYAPCRSSRYWNSKAIRYQHGAYGISMCSTQLDTSLATSLEQSSTGYCVWISACLSFSPWQSAN